MDIGGIGYPVFALDIPTRGLLIINDAARSLFAAASRDPNPLSLADIAPGGLAEKLLEAGNKALANDAWAGTLTFSNAQRGLFSAKVRLTPCGGAGEGRVVRVALLNIPENREKRGLPAFRGKRPNRAPPAPRGAGKPFRPLRRRAGRPPFFRHPVPQGAGRRVRRGPRPSASCAGGRNHAYEGTIAQDIERFGLRSLTVEDTLDSIKSIDWVLFAPHGASAPISPNRSIRSRACTPSSSSPASAPGSFGADAETRFASLMGAF